MKNITRSFVSQEYRSAEYQSITIKEKELKLGFLKVLWANLGYYVIEICWLISRCFWHHIFIIIFLASFRY
ncbi:hypothetical protein BpHYR1_021853 [Brachionus plicatilis]|uniref:Uncharacterized protein n=1 Tax=Brachionus plicatilis TaxID=10195 RepID=A0A3M7T3Y4_BRAPC|nr:hypothetical protein BpHYR1_021853 [Brachionus plicatilis]